MDPPVRRFTLQDTTVAAPAAVHCGPLTGPLNHWLGLPSPSGRNTMTLTATYSYKTYDQL